MVSVVVLYMGKTLYQKLAAQTEVLIDKGTYRTGDRLPSVREFAKQMGVSITTVTEAYRLLEDQGLVEARPQSGYYVRQRREISPLPAVTAVEAPVRVEVSKLIMRVVKDMGTTEAQLGAASPDPALLPIKKLNRFLHAALKKDESLVSVYDPPPGCEKLRRQIARRAALLGSLLSPDDIVLTIGCQEALCLALRATCEVGDTVAVETPTFHGLLQAVEMLGLKVVEVPSHPTTGMSMAALRLALEQMSLSAILVTPNHSNPSGSVMPVEARREMVELAAEHQVPIIEDDVYGDLSFSGERLPTLKSLDRKGDVLYCSSFSKTLAPGHRVGWIVPGRYMTRVLHYKVLSNLASPGLPAAAMADFLESGGYERHLRDMRRQCGRRVREMAHAILHHFPPGTEVSDPQGGFVLWVKLPAGVDALTLHSLALEQNVSVAPGPIFSANPERFRDRIRLGASHWDEMALQRLAGVVKSLATS